MSPFKHFCGRDIFAPPCTTKDKYFTVEPGECSCVRMRDQDRASYFLCISFLTNCVSEVC